MPKIKSIIIAALSLIIFSSSVSGYTEAPPIYQQVAIRLARLDRVSYKYLREFNYPSNDYLFRSEGETYLEFGKENDIAGFRFYYKHKDGITIFNNSELISLNQSKRTMFVKSKVKTADLEGNSALFNSIVTLRNVLPILIKDQSIIKTVADTMIHDKAYHLLQFALRNRFFNYAGTGFINTTAPVSFNYKIIVDQSSKLPVTVLQTTEGSRDLNRTDFVGLDTHPTKLSDNSWYFSSYATEYALERSQEAAPLIQAGTIAPDWQLTDLATNERKSLAAYKGKLLLLEFWIKNCGYCIEAVPELNKLAADYNKNDLALLAVNTEDTPKSIEQFIVRHGVKYTVLYGDDQINRAYGIAAFPQVVLTDRSGKVIYAGLFDQAHLRTIINKYL